jgi:hypothetical protein
MSLVERIKITIRASSAHPDVLTVQDAMKQVLEIFQLLTAESADGVSWRLASATTNSPLTIEGEAVGDGGEIDACANGQKVMLANWLNALQAGELPEGWRGTKKSQIAERLLKRNLNGIGQTDIDFRSGPPTIITPDRARTMLDTIARKTEHEQMFTFRKIQEYGSFEGTLQELSTRHNHPAVLVVDRKTGANVWCHLSVDLQERFKDRAEYQDFWKHQRVLVRGRMNRNENGALVLVNADDIEKVCVKDALTIPYDPTFTSGLPVSEYLTRFRDGTLDD